MNQKILESRIFWSHPSDSNRRPADYDSQAKWFNPVPPKKLSLLFSTLGPLMKTRLVKQAESRNHP